MPGYSNEIRQQAIKRVQSGESADSVARELPPSASTIRRWVRLQSESTRSEDTRSRSTSRQRTHAGNALTSIAILVSIASVAVAFSQAQDTRRSAQAANQAASAAERSAEAAERVAAATVTPRLEVIVSPDRVGSDGLISRLRAVVGNVSGAPVLNASIDLCFSFEHSQFAFATIESGRRVTVYVDIPFEWSLAEFGSEAWEFRAKYEDTSGQSWRTIMTYDGTGFPAYSARIDEMVDGKYEAVAGDHVTFGACHLYGFSS